jgi:hypothetical protein
MKIVQFIRNDSLYGVCYNVGEIAGFEDGIAAALIAKGFAVLHGDGKPKKVGERIPDSIESGNWAGAALASHIAALKQR